MLAHMTTDATQLCSRRCAELSNTWIILPGIAPMYVRLCPLISASSLTPPTDTRWKGRCSTFAIELARLVLPVPGGPTKHRMGARASGPRNLRTARYCTMRSFTCNTAILLNGVLTCCPHVCFRTFQGKSSVPEHQIHVTFVLPGSQPTLHTEQCSCAYMWYKGHCRVCLRYA